MFWKRNKRESKDGDKGFRLLKRDDGDGIRYILQARSGNNSLSFMIDSGAPYNIIVGDSLNRCKINWKSRFKLPFGMFGYGPTKGKIAMIDFCIINNRDIEFSFTNKFYIFDPETSEYERSGYESLKRESFDGVLGVPFIQNCIFDFSNNIFFVVNDHFTYK